jgi:beta-hydroxyacyl-ACP dehydratase FabZ
MNTVLDIRKIMESLPHRYPFLLLDRIVELVPRERIVALKNVTINEPFFVGHFPGKPIMPGVLIIEAMAQAGGVLVYQSTGPDSFKEGVYFLGMDQVRFRKPVVPGDQIIIRVQITHIRKNAAKVYGTAQVDDALVAEAVMMAAFGDVLQ